MLVKPFKRRYLVFDIDRCYRLLTSIKRLAIAFPQDRVETKEI